MGGAAFQEKEVAEEKRILWGFLFFSSKYYVLPSQKKVSWVSVSNSILPFLSDDGKVLSFFSLHLVRGEGRYFQGLLRLKVKN